MIWHIFEIRLHIPALLMHLLLILSVSLHSNIITLSLNWSLPHTLSLGIILSFRLSIILSFLLETEPIILLFLGLSGDLSLMMLLDLLILILLLWVLYSTHLVLVILIPLLLQLLLLPLLHLPLHMGISIPSLSVCFLIGLSHTWRILTIGKVLPLHLWMDPWQMTLILPHLPWMYGDIVLYLVLVVILLWDLCWRLHWETGMLERVLVCSLLVKVQIVHLLLILLYLTLLSFLWGILCFYLGWWSLRGLFHFVLRGYLRCSHTYVILYTNQLKSPTYLRTCPNSYLSLLNDHSIPCILTHSCWFFVDMRCTLQSVHPPTLLLGQLSSWFHCCLFS